MRENSTVKFDSTQFLPFGAAMVEMAAMKRFSVSFLLIFFFFLSLQCADARPKKGFNTGPYLALQAGIMQANFDYDEATGKENGRELEPNIGFLFGWNIWDFFSTELSGRYATSANSGRREQIVGASLSAKGFLICDSMTDFPTFRVLPFIRGGVSLRLSSLPSAVGASSDTVTSFGMGPSFGGGFAFQWHKYFYFGAEVYEDLLYFSSINQTVSGVPNVSVYKGGFIPSFNTAIILGVHY